MSVNFLVNVNLIKEMYQDKNRVNIKWSGPSLTGKNKLIGRALKRT